MQLQGVLGELPQANLGAGQVDENTSRKPRHPRCLANSIDGLLVIPAIAMGRVDAKNIHAGPQQLLHFSDRTTSWPDGGDRFGSR